MQSISGESPKFVAVAPVDEIPTDQPFDATAAVQAVVPGALPRVLFRLEAATPSFSSVSRTCTHQGCSLAGGTYKKQLKLVECDCHGSRFQVITGKVLLGPATQPLARFETRVVAGKVEVAVKPASS